jgi:hypothetical protein
MVGLKYEEPKWKRHKTWVTCHKFCKRYTLLLKLKISCRLYNFSTLVFFKYNFDTKVYFCYFLVSSWEKRERGCQIIVVERETCHWHQSKPPKRIKFVLNGSIWWGEFILGVFFFTFKVRENIFELGLIFGFGTFIFYFFRPRVNLSRVIRCFIGVAGQNGLKKGFLDKKNT